MKSLSFLKILVLGFGVSLLGGCLELNGNGERSLNPCDDNPTGALCTGSFSGTFALGSLEGSMEANLGEVKSATFTIRANPSNAGPITLYFRLDAPELRQRDPAGLISFSMGAQTLTLSPGEEVDKAITMQVSSLAPSIDVEHFHVLVSDSPISQDPNQPFAPNAYSEELRADLRVNPVYQIGIYGSGAANNDFRHPDGSPFAIGSVLSLSRHTTGVRVCFTNYTNQPFILHSSGNGNTIQHQSVAAPMQSGGFYCGGASNLPNVLQASGETTNVTVGVYSHNLGNSGQQRMIEFNAIVPVPVGIPGAL